MEPDSTHDPLERELAARLAALDEGRAQAGSVDPGVLAAGLPPGAAARLQGAIEGLVRLHARWQGPAGSGAAHPPFGKFLIERELGRGGHGIVFLALDPALNRRVALKVPRPELVDDPDWQRRFLREAEAVARLDHSDIVPILELGEVESVCYIASTYCEGPDLAAWLRRRPGPLSSRAAARLALRIAGAVGHAHARGVVHRDLKPQNILLEVASDPGDPDDPGVRPRVTDFGLAKLIEAAAPLTRTGIVLGTPRYMAPEQGQARHDLVGPPADVYAIGAILQEMLTGHPPAAGADAGANGPDVIPPARPVPPALRAIVARCLEPEPRCRYQEAAELAADLGSFLAGRRVRAAAWASRRRLLALVSPRSALVVGLMSIALFIMAARVWAPIRKPAVDPAQLGRYLDDMRLVGELLPAEHPSIDRPAMARELLARYRPDPRNPDLRSFEWYHLSLRLNGERQTLAGHEGAVYSVRYSPDGRSLASAGHDGARIWDAATGRLRLGLFEHADEVNWVEFSPDGRQVATASDDRTVQLWSTADGKRLLPPMGHGDKVVAVLFTPDGRRLIAGDRGGEVRVWDVASGDLIRQVRASDSSLDGLALTPDGSTLATAAGEVKLWDFSSFRDRGVDIPADPGQHFEGVAISHDGRRFATAGGSEHGARVWDVQSGRLLVSLDQPTSERTLSVAFSPDDRVLLATSSDRAARLWEVSSGSLVATIAGHTEWIWCGAFAPDGSLFATSGGDGTIKLWSLPRHGRMIPFPSGPADCVAIGHSADRRRLFTATSSGRCVTLDVESGRLVDELPFAPGGRLVDAAFATDASRIATVDAEGTLTVGSPHRAALSIVRLRSAAPRAHLAFSPDGRTLAYVDRDGAVQRLDVAGPGRGLGPLKSAGPAPSCLAFAPDGRSLAAGINGRLVVWDARTGRLRGVSAQGAEGGIASLAISGSGGLCATGGGERFTISLWDLDRLRVRARIPRGTGSVEALVFVHDGRTLISAGEGGAIDIWNVATARLILGLHENKPWVRSVRGLCVAPDDSSVAAFFVTEPNGAGGGALWRAARPGDGVKTSRR